MFYSEIENNGVVLIWHLFSSRQIHQIKMIANICRYTVYYNDILRCYQLILQDNLHEKNIYHWRTSSSMNIVQTHTLIASK
jgi:hypothetical protein